MAGLGEEAKEGTEEVTFVFSPPPETLDKRRGGSASASHHPYSHLLALPGTSRCYFLLLSFFKQENHKFSNIPEAGDMRL